MKIKGFTVIKDVSTRHYGTTLEIEFLSGEKLSINMSNTSANSLGESLKKASFQDKCHYGLVWAQEYGPESQWSQI